MLKQHIQFIFRIFKRNKSSYCFNTLGLTLGFFAAISALYLATSQIGYNTCFKDSNKIVRVINYWNSFESATETSSYNLGPAISSTYPEITDFCRIGQQKGVSVGLPNKEKFKEKLHFVDSSIVSMFNLTFINGDPKTAFQHPNSLVLTSKYAKKLFGNENPMGKTVNISWSNWGNYKSNFIVTGIIKEPERKSTIDFELLTNISIYRNWSSKFALAHHIKDDGWVDMNYATYIKLTDENITSDLLNKINKNGIKDFPEDYDINYLFQPIRDIYFSTIDMPEDTAPHGNLIYVIVLSLIGFIILFLSCFNYIILSTSQVILRSKEFGIRKVVGANNKWMFFQTTIECLFFTLIAVFASIILVKLFYPIMNNWFGRQAEFSLFSYPIFIPGLIMIILITVFLSTIYLNVFISRSNPVNAIAGIKRKSKSRVSLQHLLIGLQLIVFCIIFTSLLSMNKQIRYLNNYNVGFNRNNMVVLSNPAVEKGGNKKYNLFKSKILTNPMISSITASIEDNIPIEEPGIIKTSYADKEHKSIFCDCIVAQYDFIKTFGIKLKSGMDLTEDNFPSTNNCCLITESAVKALNISDPIGKIITGAYEEDSGRIVGVVEDFYVTSFYKRPSPIVICLGIDADYNVCYYIRLANNVNKEEAIKWIEKVWNKVFPGTNFTYSFYKDDYEHLYHETYSSIKMVVVFSFLALILSAISLYGMSKHISNLRTKEMSIRSVFGATVKQNFRDMIKSFSVLTLICNTISIPASVAIYKLWQKQFSFHASFSYMNVVYTFLASSFIVLITVCTNILKTANKPVVKVLKEN